MFTEYLKKPITLISISSLIILVFLGVLYFKMFAAPARGAQAQTFSLPLNFDMSQLANRLASDGYIKSPKGFLFAIGGTRALLKIVPGGYVLSKSMNVFQVAEIFRSTPRMQWIVIPEGLRKEEIGELLAKKLSWTSAELADWDTKVTNTNPDYFEGVYFPDTYLLNTDTSPEDAAKKLTDHFQEKFAPYAKEAIAQNIKWTTALKIASLVQREAAGSFDMPLVAGILWNRLLKNMRLQIDATVQYARGNTGAGWWAPVTHADLSIDSPYNTYTNSGLPPHPISNPGEAAIKAVLNPETTACLYYLHDKQGMIHCSDTYEGQQANIAKYL